MLYVICTIVIPKPNCDELTISKKRYKCIMVTCNLWLCTHLSLVPYIVMLYVQLWYLSPIFLCSGHPWICDQGVAPDRPLDPAVLSRIKQFSAMNKLKKMALQVIPFFCFGGVYSYFNRCNSAWSCITVKFLPFVLWSLISTKLDVLFGILIDWEG
jgi:hypothetical protein